MESCRQKVHTVSPYVPFVDCADLMNCRLLIWRQDVCSDDDPSEQLVAAGVLKSELDRQVQLLGSQRQANDELASKIAKLTDANTQQQVRSA